MKQQVFIVWKDGLCVEDTTTFYGVFSTAGRARRFINLECGDKASRQQFFISQEEVDYDD